MKNRKITILRFVASLFFAWALLFPSVIKFIHLESHKHHNNVCKNTKNHLHTQELDCDINQFFLASFFNNTPINFEALKPIVYKSYSATINCLFNYTTLKNDFLRGPPFVV